MGKDRKMMNKIRIPIKRNYKKEPKRKSDFKGNAFSFSPLRIMFAVGLSYIAFIILRYVPSMPAFWRVLIINGC